MVINLKNIYMSQPNSQYGNSIYFPYAAGSLIAYSFSDERIKNAYDFKGFIYKKEDPESVVSGMESPFVVGFSCYIWNYEYNKALAKAVKKAFPECITVFGGHQISEDSDISESGFADYILTGEGEESFRKLLLHLCGAEEIDNVPNLIYSTADGLRKTPVTDSQIADRVSPYVAGYFDSLVENENLAFSAILETNRGCPNKCAFCDGGNIKSRIKMYDIQTVRDEIDWMAKNKIEYCYCADSNFGLFERDLEIVDYLIKKHNETGYPQKFQATYSKNNPETVFNITRKLNKSGMSKGATLSFQSMHQNVLDNIYRKNMPLSSFKKLMSLYNQNGISAYSEIIIGLPGETYESFRDGIEQLLQAGQHMSINFFNCELLVNSIMNDPEYIKKHSIKYALTELHQYHIVPKPDEIAEISRIVVSTSAMPEDMWIKCNILSVFVRAFHNLGLLQAIAIYLFCEKGILYTDFYSSLIEWSKANPDTVCGRIYHWLKGKYEEVLLNKGSLTSVEPDFGSLTWPLDEAAFLRAVKQFNSFYDEIMPFIASFFDDSELFADLLKYQRAVVKNPLHKPEVLDFGYDWFVYFESVYSNKYSPLNRKNIRIRIDSSDIPTDLEEYAKKVIWFGRKGGQNIITKINYLN